MPQTRLPARAAVPSRPKADRPRRQRGFGLLEALIGFLLLSVCAWGLARWQVFQRLEADAARQRTEAVHLAQQRIEALRESLARPLPSALRTDGEGSANAAPAAVHDRREQAAPTPGSATVYRLHTRSAPVAGAALRDVDVTVEWDDRRGSLQRLSLHSRLSTQPVTDALLLARISPANVPGAAAVQEILDRSAAERAPSAPGADPAAPQAPPANPGRVDRDHIEVGTVLGPRGRLPASGPEAGTPAPLPVRPPD